MHQIRLKKNSSQKNLIYHIVIKYKHTPTSGGFIEKIGSYKPHQDKWKNKYVFIKSDRLFYWINRGATLNTRLFLLLKPILLTKEL